MERIICLLAVLVAHATAQICRDDTCGANAMCFPIDNRATCFCREGFIGNPYVKCYDSSKCWCWGDPHCKTFDGTFYDYQGTCPYVYSTPCNDKLVSNASLHYVVKAKNKLFYPKSPVSYVSEIEVTMYDQVLHVDEKLKFQVNGVTTLLPFYYPSKDDAKLHAQLRGSQVHIRNENYVTVQFSKSLLKMEIPHLDEYLGRDGVCGLAGNLNKNCTDDLIGKDGEGLVRKNCHYPIDKKSLTEVAKVLDTWTTNDFGGFDPSEAQCRNGQGITPDLPECDTAASTKVCLPLKQALEGTGPFAACKGLGEETLKMAYESCIFDLCFIKDGKCETFTNFVNTCQNTLGKVDLPTWRAVTQCPMKCPLGMTYKSCMSGCQATCAEPTLGEKCDKPCSEGCECPRGLLLDTSTTPAKCILAPACPCFDPQGSPHAKGTFWYHAKCTKRSVCLPVPGGGIHTEDHKCMEHGHCGVDKGYMDCVCDDGFKKSADAKKCLPK